MTIFRRASLLGFVFVPLLVLAACGDDGGGAGPTSSRTTRRQARIALTTLLPPWRSRSRFPA